MSISLVGRPKKAPLAAQAGPMGPAISVVPELGGPRFPEDPIYVPRGNAALPRRQDASQ
jgi:hypothetical protein